MTKKLTCNELHGWDCRFIATGSIDAEIKEAILAHGRREHMEMLEEMAVDERRELAERIDGLLMEQA